MHFRANLRTLTWAVAATLAVVTAVSGGSIVSASLQPTAAAPNPVAAASGGVKNVTFYYDGATPLAGSSRATLTASLGKPAIVVTTPKSDEVGTVEAIHSMGAKAYRYVQFYWAPHDADYEGINLQQHPEWAFCRSGATKSLGRTTEGGAEKWYFIDANEKAVRAQFKTILAGFKADGWDGVMFDRGEAATQYAENMAGHSVWDQKSTCTSSPYQRGARFADAYVNMLGLAHQVQLQAMMNNGKSPFDPVTPMRPNPANAACQASKWAKCKFLSDAWSNLDLVLNETAVSPKDVNWAREFTGNQRSERNSAHARRTVALITTGSLGGASHQTKANVYYAWSRIKLFDVATAVNTGDGGCPTGSKSGVCNRHGVYPELVDTLFGAPQTTAPVSQGCVSRSKIHCVWTRRYTKGVNVLNASSTPRSGAKVTLGFATCRYVYDVYAQAPMAGNKCVKSVAVKLPAWSGRPLKYSKTAWS
jgi:hypothetical protein